MNQVSRIPIIAMILAAGKGARFSGSTHKLMTEIEGVPMVRKTALSCLAASFERALIITGFESAAISAMVRDLPLTLVENPNWGQGQFSSILAGLETLMTPIPNQPFNVAFVLADQPFVQQETYAQLIQASSNHPDRIIVPRFNGKRGNPTVFPYRLFPEMMNAPIDDTGGRRWLTPENIFFLDVNDSGVLKDIDRVSDLTLESAGEAEAGV